MSVKAWEDGPSYIDMPKSMDSYSAPVMPEPTPTARRRAGNHALAAGRAFGPG